VPPSRFAVKRIACNTSQPWIGAGRLVTTSIVRIHWTRCGTNVLLGWRDNVFIERLWRSVKYEEIYLKTYESVGEARKSIANYLTWYNQQRPHSSLSDKTPDEAYFAMLPAIKTAA
jgi:hypothetical protein